MNKQRIIKDLMSKGFNRWDSEVGLDAVLRTISEELGNGGNVIIRKFGEFKTRHKAARPARDPRNGNPAIVSERTVVNFKPSKHLKGRVNG